MYTIKQLDLFNAWLNGLKDNKTRLRLARRLERASHGNLGDVAPVGRGVYEMREFFGPGWRMYYLVSGDTIIVMLGGGDKSTQRQDIDIDKAVKLAQELED